MHPARARLWFLAAALTLAGLGAGLPSTAQAAGASSEAKVKKEKKAKKPKNAKGGTVSFHDGSAESRSERDRRLTRECRGRNNAGACEGYARP